jgi:hypothetical protein
VHPGPGPQQNRLDQAERGVLEHST